MTENMSISLRKEQGFYFMQEQAKNADFSLKKGFNVHFKVTRDGKHVHFTSKGTRFLFHATNMLKNADFSLKKV